MSRPAALLAGLLALVALVVFAAAQSPPAAPPQATRAATPTPDEDTSDDSCDYCAKPGSAPTQTPRPLPTSAVAGFQTELIADRLVLPQSLAFAPGGRLFFVEVKAGALRVLNGRTLQPQPVATFDVARGAEHGLVSVTLDPDFGRNHYLYTFYTQALRGNDSGKPRRNRLTRWTEKDGTLTDETDVLGTLPFGKCCHTGGKMAFAPDGSAFLTVGDQGDADRRDAQDPTKANGKLLHFDVNQVISQRRTDPVTLIYSSGLRNPYGIDVHPVTGAPFVTDNGPDQCDELNLGRQGANFGNPTVECSPGDSRFDDPIWDSGTDRLGVTGLRIYRGAMFPEFENSPLFCSVDTGNIMRAVLTPDFNRVVRVEQVLSGADGEGCRLDLAVAADGSIYYSSMARIYRVYR